MAPGLYSQSCHWIYIQQTRCCSSLERTAYELGTQPTTLCRWSSMATETPKWVKDLCGQGRWMPLWYIRDIFEQILFHSRWSFSTRCSHCIHKDFIWMHERSHVQKMCSLERLDKTEQWGLTNSIILMFIPYLCCFFPEQHFSEEQDIHMSTCFSFVLTLASDFPW